MGDGIRTNRGNIPNCEELLSLLGDAGIEKLAVSKRLELIGRCQSFLADRVQDWLADRRLEVALDPALSTFENIQRILASARVFKKDGSVAQHMVGAKLEVSFPQIRVENQSVTTADKQLGRHGDFVLNDVAFHITVAPNQGHCQRCEQNIVAGLRPYLLVPEKRVPTARGLIEDYSNPEKVTVLSIEAFVATNLDENSFFSAKAVGGSLRSFLECYNRRVNEVETDKSLVIVVPDNLFSL